MNIINAQVEVLKEALKGKRKHNVIYGTLEDKVIIGNNTILYVIPKEECGIDLTNVDCNNIICHFYRLVKHNDCYFTFTTTGNTTPTITSYSYM